MKQNIPGAVAVVIVIIVVVVLVFFGWRKVSGGADADVTQEVIDRYQNMSKQTFSEGGSKGGDPNQMTHGAPPANAPANSAGNSR